MRSFRRSKALISASVMRMKISVRRASDCCFVRDASSSLRSLSCCELSLPCATSHFVQTCNPTAQIYSRVCTSVGLLAHTPPDSEDKKGIPKNQGCLGEGTDWVGANKHKTDFKRSGSHIAGLKFH